MTDTLSTPKRFPVGDMMLTMTASGVRGSYGLACALGLVVVPVGPSVYDRGEWGDLLAKMRGMAHADNLYRFPVVRQYCGCRACVDVASMSSDIPGQLVAKLVVRLCDRHPFADTDGVRADVITLGELRYREPESHGERRQ